MASYNRVVLMGNLTRDPEYKQLTSGQAVCRLGLAVNRQFKNRQTGNLVQEVCYIDVDVWGAQAESCRQYLQKGRAVLVEGRLKLDSWEDQNGQSRNKHSIVADRVVFLGSGAQAEDEAENSTSARPENVTTVQAAVQAQPDIDPGLMNQINQIKARGAKKKKEESLPTPTSTPTGEIDFKDAPPFEDDLPF
jgi:single-strand DNA-binding protein